MEPPPDFSPDEVRNEKAKVLRSMRIVHSEEVPLISTRGQYGSGFSGGKKTKGYLEESGVAPDSRTETFVAMKLNIDNLRWAGVPFYIRTGKNLAKRVTEIAIIFHKTPSFMFRKEHPEEVEANVLAFRIQPDEGISLKILAKLPGQAMEMRPVAMDFRYGSAFGFHLADAYERLLLDCMIGDPTLFDRIDSVEAAWSIMQPFLDAWRADASSPIPQYPSGSWGPPQSDELLQKDNRAWRLL
jgi:glucose-6-phosphate 1-dehydrogenase